MAARNGRTPAQLALAWLLTRENVVPIPGTSNVDRLAEKSAPSTFTSRLTRSKKAIAVRQRARSQVSATMRRAPRC
jgi:aryl-alcohol dehydrogenase-like predicted oxidoreductase